MWIPLGVKNFILKLEKLNDEWEVIVSDFVRVWKASLTRDKVLAISKELNPLIEADATKLTEKVMSMLCQMSAISKSVEENNNKLTLSINTNLSGITFHFKVELELQSPNVLFKTLTLPLIMLAACLQVRENKLVDIVAKKDAEIFEYKREGVTIKRSHVITKEFNMKEVTQEVAEETSSSLSRIMSDTSSIFNIVDMSLFPLHREGETVNANCKSENKTAVDGGDGLTKINITDAVGSEEKKRKKADNSMKKKKVKHKIALQIHAMPKQAKENVRVKLNL